MNIQKLIQLRDMIEEVDLPLPQCKQISDAFNELIWQYRKEFDRRESYDYTEEEPDVDCDDDGFGNIADPEAWVADHQQVFE